MPVPTHVQVRMQPVGFGDCFLVTFLYAADLDDGRRERHMLIDFGSKAGGGSLHAVAKRIAQACNGRLDAIVVTHRHQDHLSAFGQKAAGDALDVLRPRLIVRPWTEDPAAPETGRGVAGDGGDGAALGPASRRFAARLRDMQDLAAEVAGAAGKGRGGLGGLREMAFGELKNKAAIARLDRWAAAGDARYVRAGDTLPAELFPGVTIRVLGPPTLEQHETVREEGPEEEYWLWKSPLLRPAGAAGGGPFRPRVPPAVRAQARRRPVGSVGPVRWLVEQLDGQQVGSLRRIVRIMDEVLNNTSVILLITAGDRRLLFPGDAEIMNWDYVLNAAPDHAAVREELRRVDLYKVGHHGSRNATPKSLWRLWTEGAAAQHPRAALLSTRVNVFPVGETPRSKPSTAVPRIPLVNELAARTALYSTGALDPPDLYTGAYQHVPDGVTLEATTSGNATFARVP